uniref:Uncharacterized protein n=1 Tax=Arion vulgaris TaxID=1028688 RepID=A0A0B6Z275_9EUPU
MDDSQIHIDILYWELAFGKTTGERPFPCYTDVFKRDLKVLYINTQDLEKLA